MAVPNLDPRTGGACVTCISKKISSYIVGYVQLVIWVFGFFTLVFNPSSLGTVVENVGTTAIVIAGFLSLLCIAFSVVLLIGLHKDRRLYVKTYCVYVVVNLVLIVLSIIINIFLQPQKLGLRGFFFMVISILLNLLCFFVVRSYYLITYCNGSNQRQANDFKV